MPKRVKYRKPHHRAKARGVALSGNKISFGDFGIQSLEYGKITSRQIETSRRVARQTMGASAKLWIRIFPHVTRTARPADTRMGKGKGEVVEWIAIVKPGTILFEVGSVSEEVAKQALRKQAHKLPIKTRFLKKRVL